MVPDQPFHSTFTATSRILLLSEVLLPRVAGNWMASPSDKRTGVWEAIIP